MSHLVPLSNIVVGDRQRTEIKPSDQEALMSSISRIGLLHAPVVEPTTFFTDPAVLEVHYSLLAGERRLRAIQSLAETGTQIIYNGFPVPLGQIPVTFKSELTDEQRQEVELEENIRRVNLSWQDEQRAIARLHTLRAPQPLTATAQELQSMGREANAATVSRAVTVAAHLNNPKIAKARNAKEALNILTKDMEASIRADLIKATGEQSDHCFMQGSCLDILPHLVDETFDVILTDPPYGMGADDFGKAGPAHQYQDDADNAQAICQQIIIQGFRIAKPNALLFMFCDIEHFHPLQYVAEQTGWKPFRTPLIWHKTSAMGHDPWPQRGFRRSYETILFAMKGDRPYQQFMNDVIPAPNISSPVHPAAKPVELFRKLLERSCIPGDRVLDPCCGVGTIFKAATQLNLQATGIELDSTYAQIADNARFPDA